MKWFESAYAQDPSLESMIRLHIGAEQLARKARQTSRNGWTIGMTKEQVLRASGSQPRRINKTTTERGTREQWVYVDGSYLYFDETGVLVGFQEEERR